MGYEANGNFYAFLLNVCEVRQDELFIVLLSTVSSRLRFIGDERFVKMRLKRECDIQSRDDDAVNEPSKVLELVRQYEGIRYRVPPRVT
jgi:hypothetical protein